MGKRTSNQSELAFARAAQDFAPFAELPSGNAERLDEWLSSIRVQPVSAVEWQCSKHWALRSRRVADSMWFWMESGHGWGRVHADGDRFDIHPGDLILIPQGAPHTIVQARGETMHLVAVHFFARSYEGMDLFDLLGFPAHVPRRPGSPIAGANGCLAREYAVKAPGWRAAMAAEIALVLFYIARHYGSRFTDPGTHRRHAALSRLIPVLQLIESRLDDVELSVGELAKRMFVSEVQFRKLFRRVTGVSPVRFIQRRRVERACEMLREGDMTIEQIAEACGFSDPAFFYRVFKSWTHTTPGRYRSGAGV